MLANCGDGPSDGNGLISGCTPALASCSAALNPKGPPVRVEAGISRRDDLLGFRHELWRPFGERRTYLGHSIHRGVAWARITGVMSLADASGSTFLRADIRRISTT